MSLLFVVYVLYHTWIVDVMDFVRELILFFYHKHLGSKDVDLIVYEWVMNVGIYEMFDIVWHGNFQCLFVVIQV